MLTQIQGKHTEKSSGSQVGHATCWLAPFNTLQLLRGHRGGGAGQSVCVLGPVIGIAAQRPGQGSTGDLSEVCCRASPTFNGVQQRPLHSLPVPPSSYLALFCWLSHSCVGNKMQQD